MNQSKLGGQGNSSQSSGTVFLPNALYMSCRETETSKSVAFALPQCGILNSTLNCNRRDLPDIRHMLYISMTDSLSHPSRRTVLRAAAVLTAGVSVPKLRAQSDKIAEYRTPHKYPEPVLKATNTKGDFDERSVDDPIVFRANGEFNMLYIGFDGTGYQTGLATSPDLLKWTRKALVGPRDPASKYTKYNLALSSILRDKNLHGTGEAIKVGGRYLGAWHAYPNAGYEEGAAVIGLAWSHDLLRWELTEPILFPQEGASWEHGGLYRPDLLLDNGAYYLYYNAKTDPLPKSEGGGWHEQSGVATSRDLKIWTRYPENPILPVGNKEVNARDARFASNPYVVKNGPEFAMYYFGFGYQRPGRACEMLAVGKDLFHFTKVPDILIDTGPSGTIDETFAHKPCIIFHDGILYHFYCAVSGKWPNEIREVAVARSKPW